MATGHYWIERDGKLLARSSRRNSNDHRWLAQPVANGDRRFLVTFVSEAAALTFCELWYPEARPAPVEQS